MTVEWEEKPQNTHAKRTKGVSTGVIGFLSLKHFSKDHKMVILNVKLQHTDEITDSRGE